MGGPQWPPLLEKSNYALQEGRPRKTARTGPQKNLNDDDSPSARLVGKKAGKKLKTGDTLRIQNSRRGLSPEPVVVIRVDTNESFAKDNAA